MQGFESSPLPLEDDEVAVPVDSGDARGSAADAAAPKDTGSPAARFVISSKDPS